MGKYVVAITILWHSVFCVSSAFAVNSGDIIRLKKAGVSDRIVEKIIRTNAIARALLSVDEVVEMKKARIGDDVILALIEEGSATVPELDKEDALDRALQGKIKRQEMILALQKKEIDVLVEYLSRLIINPEVIKLVHEGKLASEDYARIVKYLKQYARGEETREYDYDGDINIDIKKIDK